MSPPETTKATADAKSVRSGAPSALNVNPTTSRMTPIVAASITSRWLSISSYCRERAGAGPVTPINPSSRWLMRSA
jgi:hypothetical protein